MKNISTLVHRALLAMLIIYCAPAMAQDSDGDGAPDMFDNCPATPNPGQLDDDTDGRGNACDNCGMVPNPFQENMDMDGFGDHCDNCPQIPNDQADGDSDGLGDACDGCPFNCDDGNPCTIDWCLDNACIYYPLTMPEAHTNPSNELCYDHVGSVYLIDGEYDAGYSSLPSDHESPPGGMEVIHSGTVFGNSTPCYMYQITHFYEAVVFDPSVIVAPPLECMTPIGHIVYSYDGSVYTYDPALSTLPEETLPPVDGDSETLDYEYPDGQGGWCYRYQVVYIYDAIPFDTELVNNPPPPPGPCQVYTGRTVILHAFYAPWLSDHPEGYTAPPGGDAITQGGSQLDPLGNICATYEVTYFYAIDCSDNDPCTLDECIGGVCVNTPYEPPADYLDPPVVNCFVYVGRQVVRDFVWDEVNSTLPPDYENPAGGQAILESGTLVHDFTTCYDYIVTFFYVPLDCNDNDPCTTESCNPATGLCEYVTTVCDDGDPCTFDYCDGAGLCQYVPAPNDVVMEVRTDANGDETSFVIEHQGTGGVACSGSGYPDLADATSTCCLPNGCYILRVLDAGGDGIMDGGYLLRMSDGRRIIDNTGNFSSGALSQIANDGVFCLPVGNDRLISASCDRMELRRGATASCSDKITADNTPNGTSGNAYQFWFFDPNGTQSIYYPSTTGSTNNIVNLVNLPALVEGRLYNVRVRTRISPGVWRAWGPACRMMIDNSAGQCPSTSLQDEANNSHLSCGQTKALGNGGASLVYAKPRSRMTFNCGTQNANKYQFRFRLPAEGVVIVKNGVGVNPWTYLNMANVLGSPLPGGAVLQGCALYEVEVRASFDGGATWCRGGDPYTDLAPWGKVCDLFTSGCGINALVVSNAPPNAITARMYPNPNRGDQLFIALDGIAEEVGTVSIEITDLLGKRVSTRTIPVADGMVNDVLQLNGSLPAGMYVVSITAGAATYCERLVIEP